MTEIEARLRAIETKGQELEKEMRSQCERLAALEVGFQGLRDAVRAISLDIRDIRGFNK